MPMQKNVSGCAPHGSTNEALARTAAPEFWRSLDEFSQNDEFKELMSREFSPGAQELAEGDDRRTFIKVMGASFALAGLAACRRWPESKLVPFAAAQTNRTAGVPVPYATMVETWGVAQPCVAKTFDGRPIKLDGNRLFAGAGASMPATQARVLELYDTDRSRAASRNQSPTTYADFTTWCATQRTTWQADGGKGLAILCDLSASPTLADMQSRMAKAYPNATWTWWGAANDDASLAGASAVATPDFSKASVILVLDGDPLNDPAMGVKFARDWAQGRKVDNADASKQAMSRLYIAESTLSVTGLSADERFTMRPSEIAVFAAMVAKELGVSGADALLAGTAASHILDEHAKEVFAELAKDLAKAGSGALVFAGRTADPACHAIAAAINTKLASAAAAYRASSTGTSVTAQLSTLASALDAGSVSTLVILGSNPVYDAPSDLAFAAKMKKAAETVHLSLYANETTALCSWHIPSCHALENWFDGRAWDGSIVLGQPTILPMLNDEQGGRNAVEILAELTGDELKDAYSIVRRTHIAACGLTGVEFEKYWRTNLDVGFVASSATATIAPTPVASAIAAAVTRVTASDAFEVALFFDCKTADGRLANQSWLQELPDPITKITWDNALLVSPKQVTAMGQRNGNKVELTTASGTLVAALWVVPGHADGCGSIALGYGRGAAAGKIAVDAGFNAYTVRTTTNLGSIAVKSVRNTGEIYPFAHTQDHGAIDALDPAVPASGIQERLPALVRSASLATYQHEPDFASHANHVPHSLSLWEESNLAGAKFRWAMSIDLGSCTGCSACVTACQAENNVPVVGKDQVARGREMHWIRVDRYFRGADASKPNGFAVQPIACMHCENAPCEQVCPVAATVHDEQGLNAMVYNRCIGTRYCSNNCPYKVRRFNFFDWNRREPVREGGVFMTKPEYYTSEGPNEWARMQFNPEVTVRMRGVMEKCTFCVQRIQGARIETKNAWALKGGVEGAPDWAIADGTVQTACQEACPTGAIVFGDLNVKTSEVAAAQKGPRSYGLLDELNTKPRLKYLARVWNPAIDHGADAHDHSHEGHEAHS